MKECLFSLITVVVLTNQIACKSIDEQILCFRDQQTELRHKGLNMEIFSQFSDSLNLWLSKDLYGIMRFKKKNYKIDENIFINNTNNKCVIAILSIDTLKPNSYSNIELVFGRLVSTKKWQFIISSMPSIGYNYGEPYEEGEDSYEAMSIFLQRTLMKGGYYKSGKCEIDDKWVNGWLNDYRIKYHQEFLEGKRL